MEISSIDADRWIGDLGLTEKQAIVLRRAVADYVTQQSTELPKIVAASMDLARSVAKQGGSYASEAALATTRTLLEERKRAVRGAAALEEALFTSIAAGIGGDDGAAIADRVRQLRRIDRAATLPHDLRLATLNLRSVIQPLKLEARLVNNDIKAWSELLAAYDKELAGIEERRVEHSLRYTVLDAEACLRLKEDTGAFVQWRNEQLESKLRFERAIVAANARWANALAELLTAGAQADFRRSIAQALYPELYPNPLDLEPVLTALEQLPSASRQPVSDYVQEVSGEIALTNQFAAIIQPRIDNLLTQDARSVSANQERAEVTTWLADLHAKRIAAARRALDACSKVAELRETPALRTLRQALESMEAQARPSNTISGPAG